MAALLTDYVHGHLRQRRTNNNTGARYIVRVPGRIFYGALGINADDISLHRHVNVVGVEVNGAAILFTTLLSERLAIYSVGPEDSITFNTRDVLKINRHCSCIN